MSNHKSIILFDGICNLCNLSVQFILKKDKKNKFLFASLQSDAAKNILLHKDNEKIFNADLNTIYLVKKNKIYSESTAILLILKQLKLPYNLLYAFIIVPKFIRDYCYKVISRNRYKWFGKRAICMVPKKKYLDKFIT